MADIEKVKKGIKACLTECIFLKHYNCPYKTDRDDYKCVEQLREDVLELLKEQQPKWIPVEERLPEENISPITHDYTEVVCYTTFGDVRVYKFGEGHFFKGPGVMDHLVTHWQYLPESPKEGEAE